MRLKKKRGTNHVRNEENDKVYLLSQKEMLI